MIVPVRFWQKVRSAEDVNLCWEWTAAKTVSGYGWFRVGGTSVYAHRWLYEQTVGSVPRGLELDHLCRNRACVNPAHLEAVTKKENILRGVGPTAVNARKTHCDRGHEFTERNTHRQRDKGRSCKACRREVLSVRWLTKVRREGMPESWHGTLSGYISGGCRCDLCRAARARNARENRKRVKALVLAGTLTHPHNRTGYAYGCRCDVCHTAELEYKAAWKASRRRAS